ncbi:hypothetical protein FQN54_001505 [Arachnomyces sp. PD_36]|nr:hypothetical protein FQN54_001505 [Arachnomyces sp. PD_36]
MPPRKRASTGSSAQPPKSKNAKTTNKEASPPPQPRSRRWTAICVSANLDADYAGYIEKDADKAFSFVCFCPPGDDDDDDDDEDEDEESGSSKDAVDKPKVRCDDGKKCLCHKAAADHPEHAWAATEAGLRKVHNTHIHATLREPDLFDLYIYNDFHSYGIVEVIQNLFLDFVEVGDNWKEQWAICEGAALFTMHDAFMPITMVDDGAQANETYCLLGGMFLATIANLEAEGLLGPDSEVKNLGFIMALHMETTAGMRDYGISEDHEESKKVERYWNSDAYILAYARKYNIELRGPSKIEKCVKDLEKGLDKIKLPKTAKDPWAWDAALKEYEKRYGVNKKPKIGGNEYDITAMSSAERKKSHFKKKDPLGKKELDAIKAGLIMQLA